MRRHAPIAVFATAIAAALLALTSGPASAAQLRNHESSFGAFGAEDPQALALDQSNGDLYVVSAAENTVSRYSSTGTAKDFTAGPDAGTNTLSGFNFDPGPSAAQVAIDSSGGPADGTIYVTDSFGGAVKAFAEDGTSLASLDGSSTPSGSYVEPCGVAVDQANGDVYVGEFENRIWRYSPSGGPADESDYSGGITVSANPCQLAVASGSLYSARWEEKGPLRKYATSELTTADPPPAAASTVLDPKATAVATDPSNGDVYVDEGDEVAVFSSSGAAKYSFGSPAELGTASAGVAVRAGGNAYVSDPTSHEVDVFGATLEPGNRASLFSFGAFTGSDPRALTVDQSNGDVYAISTATNTVARFNSAGLPKDFSAGPDAGTNTLTSLGFQDFGSLDQVAIDNSGGPSDGNVYVTQSGAGAVKVFSSEGEPLGTLNGSETPAGSFGEDCGVAVDQANGDVYVAGFANRVWRYSPSGATVAETDYSGGVATSFNPCQLAVAQGSLYAHNWTEGSLVGAGPLRKLATSEFATGSPPSPSATQIAAKSTAVATDPSNGDVYVDEGDKVTVYGSSGSAKYSFGSGDFGTESAGVAVKAGGNAYVSDPSAHEIDVYGPFSAPPPIVETEAATGVKHTKATLHGHLDPSDSLPITACAFEWGTDVSYGSSIPCAEGTSFTEAADVSAELTGLTPGTTYHFRLHVTTGSGGFAGSDESFEAIPASSVPEVVTGKGAILSSTSSQLNGTVNPNANPVTDCRFEYVRETAFESTGFSDLSSGGSLPCDQVPGSIPVDFEDHEVSAVATGLDPAIFYRFRLVAENVNGAGTGSDALVPGPPLVETTGSPTRTATTARFDSRVSPHGAETAYRFEYVTDSEFEANGFANAKATASLPMAANEVQRVMVRGQNAEGAVDHFKLSFGGYTTPELPMYSPVEEVQAALRALPSIGSSNVSVRYTLEDVFDSVYTVTFEGALADTDVESLVASAGSEPTGLFSTLVSTAFPGGPNDRISFVSAGVGGLQPATTYRYRIVAENPGGPSAGAAATLTTRASDAPLSHGDFAGPAGSDRAWEQVNVSDTGGNPVNRALAFSDDGNRAAYGIEGGSPGSNVGSQTNQLFAERTASGWQSSLIYPTRTEAPANSWSRPIGSSDLSRLFVRNFNTSGLGAADFWQISPFASPQRVYSVPDAADTEGVLFVSDDASRLVVVIRGQVDPDHPVAPGTKNLYDITSGTPELIGFLPGGSAPDCGVGGLETMSNTSRTEHWVSADGSHAFFLSQGNNCVGAYHLYVRDLENEETTQISSGPSKADLIRSTADAAFFTIEGSLVPEDEGGNDVYRYDLDGESIDCLTCFPGHISDVHGEDHTRLAVSDDGSRLYFISSAHLLPGVANQGIYRLDVGSGDLAYVAPTAFRAATTAGDTNSFGNAISPDGSVFVFRAEAPDLNSLNGPQNDVTAQYYRYDDTDRSLVCVSCPADGALPRGAVDKSLLGGAGEVGPNLNALSDAGDLAFTTPTPLVAADQNTAGPSREASAGDDVYEWRDGRLLLVTDGLTSESRPRVAGVDRSGRNIFFTQVAQLTPDAIDAYQRLYDARIGGGFEFPTPPPPCSLEACQGTPKGAPEESRPGSGDYAGPGDSVSRPRARCRKRKVHRKGRCVAKPGRRGKARGRANRSRRPNHDRRAAR